MPLKTVINVNVTDRSIDDKTAYKILDTNEDMEENNLFHGSLRTEDPRVRSQKKL